MFFGAAADKDLVDPAAVHVEHLETISVRLGAVALLRRLAQLLHQEAGDRLEIAVGIYAFDADLQVNFVDRRAAVDEIAAVLTCPNMGAVRYRRSSTE
ncbi:hypothetical protein ABIE77_004228 [Sinorhizobium fredii]